MQARRKFSTDSTFQGQSQSEAALAGPPTSDPNPTPTPTPGPRRRTSRRDHRSPAARAGRDLAERLVMLAPHLPPNERALVESVFGDGKTCVDLARLIGRNPRSVRAQLARITARMSQPLFAWVVLHESSLPRALRTIARDCILHGKSVADVARAHNIPYHQARQMRQALITLARTRVIGPAAAPPASPCGVRARARPRAKWRTSAPQPDRAAPSALFTPGSHGDSR